MKRIAYLLHRFPAITDTFIKREIRFLQKAGTPVHVISVWKPRDSETTPAILSEWASDTEFMLPRSPFGIAYILLKVAISSPLRFLRTFGLALAMARPGVRGFFYQMVYFLESVLAADALTRNKIGHVHNHIGDQAGTVTMLAAQLAGIGYSITFHGWPVFFDARNSRIKEKVLGARFTRSISYFCRSQLMMFSETDDPAPFKMVHCGLSIDKYPYREPKEQVRRLFCAARFSPEKGMSFLIQAFRILRDNGHDLELRLAGGGPSKESLASLVKELGLSAQVHFLGYLSEDEVIRELRDADLFVLPSFVEGLPVSAMEAMAVGVPVIATNIAGTSELIEHGKSGILVRPSDAKAIADAVAWMIGDYGFRRRAAELGRRKVVEEFDIEKETARLNAYLLQSCD